MEKIIIEKDNCNDVEHFVKFNLHKYNQKNHYLHSPADYILISRFFSFK